MSPRMSPVGGGKGTTPYGGAAGSIPSHGTRPADRPSGILPESEYCQPGAEPLGGAVEPKDDAE